MTVRFGLLKRGPVFVSGGSGSAGFIKKAVMLPASFRVAAFSVRRSWWQKPKWFAPTAIEAATAEAIWLAPDGPVADRITAGATALNGKPVQTVSGVKLGRVRDFAFMTDNGDVVELTVASAPLGPCWPRECVVERAAVVRAEPGRIIVRDSIVPVPGSKVALKGSHF